MTFVAIIIALFIARVATTGRRAARAHAWFDRYCDRLTNTPRLGRWVAHRFGALMIMLPPLLLIAWLQALAAGLGALFGLAFSVVLLLFSLGPGDLGDDAEGFVDARDAGDEDAARQKAEALCPDAASEPEPGRSVAVARALLIAANGRLIGPLFWFVVFGASGAAAYRMIHLLAMRSARQACPQGLRRGSEQLRDIADWIPARLTATGYAIAGNFDAVVHAWQSVEHRAANSAPSQNEQLLANTGLAALGTLPDDADMPRTDVGQAPDPGVIPPVVEDALALVWRTLAIWVAGIGGGSLIMALA